MVCLNTFQDFPKRHRRVAAASTLTTQKAFTLAWTCRLVSINVRLDADPVVNRVSKMLLAAKISLGGLHGNVAEKKLDLVQIPTGIAAQPGTGSAKVMWCQIRNGCTLGAVLYNMPHDPLRYTISPDLACTAHAPKHAAFGQASRDKPGIDGGLDPIRNGYRPNMPRFAYQVDDSPVILPPLKMSNVKLRRFFPAQPAAHEDAQERAVPFALERARVRDLPEHSCLVGSEPITKTNAEVLRPFDPADASS